MSKIKEYLTVSFCVLASAKSIQQITIKELVLKAGISRSSFYLHYQNMHEFIDDLKDDFINNLQPLINLSAYDFQQNISNLVNYINKNQQFLLVMTGKNGDISFVEKLDGLIEEILSKQKLYFQMNVSQEYAYKILSKSITTVVLLYLSKNNSKNQQEIILIIEEILRVNLRIN